MRAVILNSGDRESQIVKVLLEDKFEGKVGKQDVENIWNEAC